MKEKHAISFAWKLTCKRSNSPALISSAPWTTQSGDPSLGLMTARIFFSVLYSSLNCLNAKQQQIINLTHNPNGFYTKLLQKQWFSTSPSQSAATMIGLSPRMRTNPGKFSLHNCHSGEILLFTQSFVVLTVHSNTCGWCQLEHCEVYQMVYKVPNESGRISFKCQLCQIMGIGQTWLAATCHSWLSQYPLHNT